MGLYGNCKNGRMKNVRRRNQDHDQDGTRGDPIDGIKGYIASMKAGQPLNAEGGIFVRLSDVQLDTLSGLVKTGIAVSEEEFIRKCLLDKIVPKSVEDETIENAFRAAQMKAAYK